MVIKKKKRVKEMHENDWLCVRPIHQKSGQYYGPVCLLESSFLLESEFWESKFQKSELFSDIW